MIPSTTQFWKQWATWLPANWCLDPMKSRPSFWVWRKLFKGSIMRKFSRLDRHNSINWWWMQCACYHETWCPMTSFSFHEYIIHYYNFIMNIGKPSCQNVSQRWDKILNEQSWCTKRVNLFVTMIDGTLFCLLITWESP